MIKLLLIGLTVAIATFGYANEPLRVEVQKPQIRNAGESIILSGNVEAIQNSRLAALESGVVAQIQVEVGDHVSKGQPLLQLDDTLARLELEVAEAELAEATVNEKEAQRLLNEGIDLSKKQVVPQTLLGEREASVAAAKARLERATATIKLRQEIVRRHTLSAPFDGVVAQRNVDVGEWVTQQSNLLDFVATADLRLAVSVPQEYFTRLSDKLTNRTVVIIPDSPELPEVTSTFDRIVPVSQDNSRSFLGYIPIASDSGMVAGMSARARISLTDNSQQQIILPRSAIKQHPDGGSSIFVVEGNRAKRIIVSFEDLGNNMVAIYGASSDKMYIISGIEVLRDDMLINPQPRNSVNAG